MRTLRLAFVLALAAAPLAANADTYSFTISTGSTATTPGTIFNATGTLTGNADPYASAALDITSITGGAQGYSFTGIVPGNVNSQQTATMNGLVYDNVLFTDPNAAHVDANGILVTLQSPIGTSLARVYSSNGYHVDVFDPNDPGDVTPFAIQSFVLTPSAVPEPGTLALMGTGALGAFGMLRRRFVR
jgi:hypothetical protein